MDRTSLPKSPERSRATIDGPGLRPVSNSQTMKMRQAIKICQIRQALITGCWIGIPRQSGCCPRAGAKYHLGGPSGQSQRLWPFVDGRQTYIGLVGPSVAGKTHRIGIYRRKTCRGLRPPHDAATSVSSSIGRLVEDGAFPMGSTRPSALILK